MFFFTLTSGPNFGEYYRGLGFFAGYTTSVIIFYSSAIEYIGETITGEQQKSQVATMTISGVAAIGIWIWSIVDASQVAKINNLYFRDQADITLKPSLNILPYNNVGYGLSLRINF